MIMLLVADAASSTAGGSSGSDNLTLILVALIGMAGVLATVAIPLYVQMRRTRSDAGLAHTAATAAAEAVNDVKKLHEKSLGLLEGIDASVNQKEPHEPTIRENVAHAVKVLSTLDSSFTEHIQSDQENFETLRQNHLELIEIIADNS